MDPLRCWGCRRTVDEVDDCAATGTKLLNFLLYAGLPMVMVGDLDQIVYGFRGLTRDAMLGLAVRSALH
jgi:hypothetical protein